MLTLVRVETAYQTMQTTTTKETRTKELLNSLCEILSEYSFKEILSALRYLVFQEAQSTRLFGDEETADSWDNLGEKMTEVEETCPL